MTVNAYPLAWPTQFPRAKYRESGKFKASLASALNNVRDSLRLFASDSGKKIESVIISSNVTLGENRPADPGVAVWFIWDGIQICIPVDRYNSTEANLQAIHHILEARRVELRHGTLTLVRATFTGFAALPPPGKDTGRGWRTLLGFEEGARPSLEQVEQRYRSLISEAHPDRGGNQARAADLNEARDQARKELGA